MARARIASAAPTTARGPACVGNDFIGTAPPAWSHCVTRPGARIASGDPSWERIDLGGGLVERILGRDGGEGGNQSPGNLWSHSYLLAGLPGASVLGDRLGTPRLLRLSPAPLGLHAGLPRGPRGPGRTSLTPRPQRFRHERAEPFDGGLAIPGLVPMALAHDAERAVRMDARSQLAPDAVLSARP